jgi:hypothetical protein
MPAKSGGSARPTQKIKDHDISNHKYTCWDKQALHVDTNVQRKRSKDHDISNHKYTCWDKQASVGTLTVLDSRRATLRPNFCHVLHPNGFSSGVVCLLPLRLQPQPTSASGSSACVGIVGSSCRHDSVFSFVPHSPGAAPFSSWLNTLACDARIGGGIRPPNNLGRGWERQIYKQTRLPVEGKHRLVLCPSEEQKPPKSIHNIDCKHAKSPKTDILWLPYSSIFEKIWKAHGHPI